MIKHIVRTDPQSFASSQRWSTYVDGIGSIAILQIGHHGILVEFIDHDQIVHGIFIATQLLTLRLSTEKVDLRKALEAIAQHLR